MDSSIRDLLYQRAKPLVTLSSSENVQDALDKLEKNLLTGALVFDDKKNVLGFVDVLDIMAFLVSVCTRTLTHLVAGESRKLNTDDLRMVRRRQKDFKLEQVGDLVDYSKRNPFKTLDEGKTVKDAIELFSQGIHRIAVTSASAESPIIGVLSQSDLIYFLASNKSELPSKFQSMQIKSMPSIMERRLLIVTPETPAVDVFLAMHEKGISSVAITNPDGTLAGTLSASDVRTGKLTSEFPMLLLDVIDFMKECRKEQGKPSNYLVCCTPQWNFMEVIHLLHKENVHRAFVTDETSKKAISVISMTDVMKELQQVTHAAF